MIRQCDSVRVHKLTVMLPVQGVKEIVTHILEPAIKKWKCECKTSVWIF